MEIILVKPVRKLGKLGELVNVKTGFGRNYLIPQKIAVRATEQNKKLIESQRHEFEQRNAQEKADAQKFSKKVEGNELTFIRQAADDGRLFGSVNNKEIGKELSKVLGHEIAYSNVMLDAPIKTSGVFTVEVMLHAEVSVSIIVTVARSESEALDALRNYKSQHENPAQEAAAAS